MLLTTSQEQADREAVKAILEQAHKDRHNMQHSWLHQTLFWRPSVMILPPVPFILVAIAVFIAGACVFIWAKDSVTGTSDSQVPVWRILLFVFVMIGMAPPAALASRLTPQL